MTFRTRTLEGLLKGGGYIFAVWVNGGKHTIECLRLGDFKSTKVTLRNCVCGLYWEALQPSIEIWTCGQLLFENTEQWITWLGNCASEYELQKIWAVWKHITDWSVPDAHMTYCSMTSGKVLKRAPKFEKCRHSIAVQDWLASFLLHHKKHKQIPGWFTVLAFCHLGFSHKMSYFFWPWKDLLFGQKRSTLEGRIKEFRSFKKKLRNGPANCFR